MHIFDRYRIEKLKLNTNAFETAYYCQKCDVMHMLEYKHMTINRIPPSTVIVFINYECERCHTKKTYSGKSIENNLGSAILEAIKKAYADEDRLIRKDLYKTAMRQKHSGNSYYRSRGKALEEDLLSDLKYKFESVYFKEIY